MFFSANSREDLSHEDISIPTMIERRWSVPSAPPRREDVRMRWSDITFEEHSTCSETEAEKQNKAYEELRTLTKDGPEPIQDRPHCFMKCSHDICEAFILSHMNADIVREHECHECASSGPRGTIGNTDKASAPVPTPIEDMRLKLYAKELRDMTQRVMHDLASSGGTEPFPAYNEVDYFEGIAPFSLEHEKTALAPQAGSDPLRRPRSSHPLPSQDDCSIPLNCNFSINEQSIAANASASDASPSSSNHSTRHWTRPASTEFGATDRPTANLLGDKRVRRKKACYFSISDGQTDSNGEPLITRSLRDSSDG
ncbi:hypothetical protein E8E12_007036 [Didymella heteroderae]|uniref:Uncharacterized protein n=1 Tax=Didymella heteroderae TaxID=1769908 RepID=A0A9P5C0T5_9PLEO|nr:hypothetical protein E8E12_007036 [Didymella heteroderae]